jgi:capsular polysaccharide transport system permease protein
MSDSPKNPKDSSVQGKSAPDTVPEKAPDNTSEKPAQQPPKKQWAQQGDQKGDQQGKGKGQWKQQGEWAQQGGQKGQWAQGNQGGQNAQGGGQGGQKGKWQPATVVEVKPMASPASLHKRHLGLLISFVAVVLLPFVAAVFYLWTVALDQYGSTTGFTVRQEEASAASELLGGLSSLAGGGGSADGDILYEFIQSLEIVNAVDDALDLRSHYQTRWEADPVFALNPKATAEDLLDYWQRIVRISYDQGTGLIEVRVLSYSADMAQKIAQEIVSESQAMINALNDQARGDALRYAQADLDEAVTRLKTAREALTQFRSRTQIVDPEADLQGRMGVMNNLQQQLAEALIEHDLLLQTTSGNDPRLVQALRRIEVSRDRIRSERDTFTSNNTDTGAVGEDYPNLLAEFEALTVDREYAEETYRASLAALELARANAARQSRYLATYVRPTLAQSSEYPRRFVLVGLALLILTLVWSILALIYYSIRDRN